LCKYLPLRLDALYLSLVDIEKKKISLELKRDD
jgi:hypothetical protein